MHKKIKITQIKSSIGCLKKHKITLSCLGLRHIRHSIYVLKTKPILGMIKKISYMIKIEK